MNELPTTFGKYYLTEKLATGGMAEIYLAKILGPAGFEKQLVIKQIHPRLSGQRQFVDMFVAEAKTLVGLTHGNIVPVYELGVVDDTYFIAMEYIDGPTLYRFTEAALRTGAAIAPALAAWVAAAGDRPVAIAVQGWIKDRGPGETVVQTPWPVDSALLARVAFAACGEEDLVDQGDLLDRLCRHVPIVAFTHGKRGCDVIVRGHTTKVGIYPRAVEVDPTGAGDTFAAGFFLGLAEGRDPVAAAKLGAAAASVVVEGRGGATLGRVGEAHARVAQIA